MEPVLSLILGGLIMLGMFLVAAGVALFGMGQAMAALRARGGYIILAAIGLVISGMYIGFFIGLFAVAISIAGGS